MKIGSKIRPSNGKQRRVTVHDQLYVFCATPDNKGAIHFVADVTNEQHAEIFLGSGHFYAFGKDIEPQPTLTRSGTGPAAALAAGAMSAVNAGASITGDNGGTDSAKPGANPNPPALTGHAAEDVATATELLKGSISDVSKDVAKHTLAAIRAALDLEKASPNPRKGMVTLLEATLEGAKQAGVEG